ncbi:class I SAM-dependent methyltransferase [Castellaniella hirudinis]|uniref:class I SAM-dependent methyltransferase n=1 Tax=Castellaniella hirudinis TaxID=1144617 RepID=UPI0039C16432
MGVSWSQGYFTDVGYTYGYYRDISPAFQRFCLLLRGFDALQATPDAVHCELGFGQGISVNIHAAATPGHYVGTDFNPAQAAHANQLARASGSGARLYDDSFEQLLARPDLPQFDSISLHGIWTWVSRDNHKVVAEFARRHLKPGGVFYVSYNCFPGWSPAYPLRQIFALHDRFASTHPGAVERVEQALKFSENLLAAKPAYLRQVPGLEDKLKAIAGQNRHYLAHEYFNQEWNCMYFTDVVDALESAKLDYAGTAVPLDVVDAINLTAPARSFLGTIEHPILREQTRDYFVGQQFRKDLYMRGARRLTPVEQRQLLLEMRFALLKAADAVTYKVTTPLGEATMQEALYAPLVAALADKQYSPKTLAELAAQAPALTWPQLIEALTVLVGMGAATPCQTEAAAKQVHKRCSALNQYLIGRAQLGNDIQALASPVVGGGVAVSRFCQLFLLARQGGHKQASDWAQFAWKVLQAQGQRLLLEGKTIESPEDNLAELTRQAQEFHDKQLPILRALQVAG